MNTDEVCKASVFMDDELYINSAKERIKDQLAIYTDEVYPQNRD